MQRGPFITLAIHADAVRSCAIAGNRRIVVVTAMVGTHDAGHVHAQRLADTVSHEIWNALEPAREHGVSEQLAAIASKKLQEDGEGTLLSFTFLRLDDGRASIWNCGGHRVLTISDSGATRAAMDGFADTSNEMLRTVVREAAGPDLPVPTAVIHQANVNLCDSRLLVISPHGQLLSLPGLADCACVEDVAAVVEREAPGLPHALVCVSGVG